jgi:thymidylate synthase (FAD)
MPYAELLEFNQPNPVRKEGYSKIRDSYDLSIATGRSEQNPSGYYDPERIVEFAGRSDYGVKNAQKLGSDDTIISRWIDSGHHSMLEFASATFYIECSRVVSHELVRHRLASFQQESQRYVKYEDAQSEDLFFLPELDGDAPDGLADKMGEEFRAAFGAYKILRDAGVKAQIARYVLPNATMTRMVMKANLREWRHIVNLRTAKAAQPEMQELANMIKEQLEDVFPKIMHGAVQDEQIR